MFMFLVDFERAPCGDLACRVSTALFFNDLGSGVAAFIVL